MARREKSTHKSINWSPFCNCLAQNGRIQNFGPRLAGSCVSHRGGQAEYPESSRSSVAGMQGYSSSKERTSVPALPDISAVHPHEDFHGPVPLQPPRSPFRRGPLPPAAAQLLPKFPVLDPPKIA